MKDRFQRTGLWLSSFAGMMIFIPIMAAIWFVERFDLVSLDYDGDAAVCLVVCSRVLHRWAPEAFIGWGHPFACLFKTHGLWLIEEIRADERTP